MYKRQVGNCCGQRYGIQYHTPTAGNSCGSPFVTGYLAAEYVKNDLDNGIGGGENGSEERTTNGQYYAGTYTCLLYTSSLFFKQRHTAAGCSGTPLFADQMLVLAMRK